MNTIAKMSVIMTDKELYNPDEFVFEDVKMVHYEVMNESSVWMGIYLNDGKMHHLNIHGDNLRVSLSDETT
jgi:hypothetical protein